MNYSIGWKDQGKFLLFAQLLFAQLLFAQLFGHVGSTLAQTGERSSNSN